MADYLADLLCERLEHFGDWLVGKLNSTMKLEFLAVKSSIHVTLLWGHYVGRFLRKEPRPAHHLSVA